MACPQPPHVVLSVDDAEPLALDEWAALLRRAVLPLLQPGAAAWRDVTVCARIPSAGASVAAAAAYADAAQAEAGPGWRVVAAAPEHRMWALEAPEPAGGPAATRRLTLSLDHRPLDAARLAEASPPDGLCFRLRRDVDVVVRPDPRGVAAAGGLPLGGVFPHQTLYSEWVFVPAVATALDADAVRAAVALAAGRSRRFGA